MTLDFETIKNSVTWVLVVIAAVAVVLAIVIKKIIGKIITLLVAALLIFLGWQQRAKVIDFAQDVKAGACASRPHFLGIAVTYPGC